MENQEYRPFYLRNRALLCIGLPTLCVLFYLSVLAKPSYESEALIIVKSSEKTPLLGIPGVGGGLMGSAAPASIQDAYILIEYMKTPEMVRLLDDALQLSAHYASPKVDLIRKLPAEASADDVVAYFRKQLHLKVASDSGLISMSLKAFDPELAQAVLERMIEQTELALNGLNQRIRQSSTDVAYRELEKTKEDLKAVRMKLFAFQVEKQVIQPETEIQMLLANLAELDANLLSKKTELKTREQFLKGNAFELKSIRQEIEALEAQRKEESETLFLAGDNSIPNAAHEFESLRLESEFALQSYTAALAAFETAKLEALRQEKFLLTVSAPTEPTEPAYPRPLTGALLAFIILSLVYAIVRLIVATVLDHTV